MTLIEATKTCFRKYVTFSGRASRSEYWWFFVAVLGITFVGSLIDTFVLGIDSVVETGPVEGLLSLATFLPSLSAAVRRLHDTDKPWYYILVPVVMGALAAALMGLFGFGNVVVLILAILIGVSGVGLYIYWLAKPSDSGPNRYGPNPHGVQNYGEVFE